MQNSTSQALGSVCNQVSQDLSLWCGKPQEHSDLASCASVYVSLIYRKSHYYLKRNQFTEDDG